MDFTYDLGDLSLTTTALRFIGRSLQARLAEVSSSYLTDPRLKRRFAPVWHADILNTVKKNPRTLIGLLHREGAMINALVALGTRRDARSEKRFLKTTAFAAQVLRVDSDALLDLILRTGAENLVDRRILKHSDALPPRSPDARIGGHENRDYRSPDSSGQMTDPRIVSDIQPGC
jgi:hypothetical protein